ncbi:MAG: DEAD/DEAH box helicase [Lentisphaeria bacterium]|nr:DEAD/DEAH box helicase [Lentisphaeria bacterium]
MTDFQELGLSENLLRGIADLGFEIPTPVQAAVIPKLLEGDRDLIAQAQTGTGKTAAFGLPVLQRVNPSSPDTQALILAPTRELCMQISRDLEGFAKRLPGIRVTAVYGGAAIDKQIRDIKRGAQVVVATPGRLNDLLRRSVIDLSTASVVVLDEADEMLNMGFLEDLETILSHLPDTAQTLLFSATMPQSVATIAKKYMTDAETVVLGTKNAGAENVTHEIHMVHAHDRYAALRRVIDFYPNLYAIIFCRTRAETADVANHLMKDGYSADVLHGDLSQTQRDAAMNRFRLRNVRMLVATDVAARGLDVDDLTHVINYNLPDQPEIYTHRSGRTGRAGRMGVSVSFIHMRERYKIKQIEKVLQRKLTLKPVPSGDEVCGAQLRGLIERVREIEVDHERIAPHIETTMNMLEGMDRESVIKHFVSLEFNRFLKQYSKAPDLNVRAEQNNERGARPAHKVSASLRMNIGEQDGLEPRELINVINDVTKGRRVAVGRISVKNNFTLFEVEQSEGEAVAKALSGLHYEDQVIDVKVVGEGGPIEPGGPRGPRRQGPSRGAPAKSRGNRPGPRRGRGR